MNIPNEVNEFWSHVRPMNNVAKGINFLQAEVSSSYADSLSQIEVFEVLGLIPLEDSNNSNPVCYVTAGCAAGVVMLLSHDEGSKIIFNSLSDFKDCIEENLNTIEFFSEFIEELPAG